MRTVCIDASLAVNWLLPTQQNRSANRLWEEWAGENVRLVTAPLFHAELTSAIRAQVYFGKLPAEDGENVFSVYLGMDVESIDGPELQQRVWLLAKRFNLPRTYDLQYVAVADLQRCDLWTSDKRLANSLRNKGNVRLVG